MSPSSDPKEELFITNIRKDSIKYSNLSDVCPGIATDTSLFDDDSKSSSITYDHNQSPTISAPEIPRRPKRKGPSMEAKESSEQSNPTDQRKHALSESIDSDKNLPVLQMSQTASKETASERKFVPLQEHYSKVDSPIDEQFNLINCAISDDSLDLQDGNFRSDILRLDSFPGNKAENIKNVPVVPSKRPLKSTKKNPRSDQDGKSSTSCLGGTAFCLESHVQQRSTDPSADFADDSEVSYTTPFREETLFPEPQNGKEEQEMDKTSDEIQLPKGGVTAQAEPSKTIESTMVDMHSTELEASSQKKHTASKKPSSKIAAFQQMFENRQQNTNASLRSEKNFEHPPKATATDHNQPKPFEQAYAHAKDANLNAQFIKNLNGMIGMALPGMVVPGVSTESSVDMEAPESESKHDYAGSSFSEVLPLKNTLTGRIKGPRGKRLPRNVTEPFEKPKSCFELFIEDIWQLTTGPSTISERSVSADSRVTNEVLTMTKKEEASSSENQSSNDVSTRSSQVLEELEKPEMNYDGSKILAKEHREGPREKVITEIPIQAVGSISDDLSIDSASH
ncbi:BA75_03372T0 [Komagataella pastoris]|uniref:BA75_03372T0 n=1 Tax=Komagataella pastoris TaxID=4922 RepID=A0A1B2JF76_PICPA|nr:BA75_03372T0 [Komagataella pastoris]